MHTLPPCICFLPPRSPLVSIFGGRCSLLFFILLLRLNALLKDVLFSSPLWEIKINTTTVFVCYLTFQAAFNFLLQLFLCIRPCVCCICVHTCVQACMQAPVHTRASRGQRLVLGCLPQLLPHLIFWKRVSHWISSLPIWLDCPGIRPLPPASACVQRATMPGSYAGAGDLNVDSHAHTANTLSTEPSLQSLDPICLNTHSITPFQKAFQYINMPQSTQPQSIGIWVIHSFYAIIAALLLLFPPALLFFAGHVSWCRGSIISLDGNASDHFVCIGSPLLSKVKFLLHHGFSSLHCCPLCGCFTQLKQWRQALMCLYPKVLPNRYSCICM